jgi:hypothetical protein
VFVTAPDTASGGLFRLQNQAGQWRAERAWSTELDTCHGGWVVLDGALYGSFYRQGKGWGCVETGSGAVRYRVTDLAAGSVLYADGRLYCLAQDGEMALVKPTASGFDYAGRFRLVPERKDDVWTHPVIVDGRLYLRYQETLRCYDIRARRTGPE